MTNLCRACTHVNGTNLLTLYQAGSGTHDGMFIKPTYTELGPPPRNKTFEQVLQSPCIQNRLSKFAEPVIVIHENLLINTHEISSASDNQETSNMQTGMRMLSQGHYPVQVHL